MKKYIKMLTTVIILSFLLIYCGDDDSNPVKNGGNTSIKGRVTDNSGYGNGLQKVSNGVEGATVTTAEIQADGSLKTVSEASVQTDANGIFEITTNSAGKSNLVVVAAKGTNEWKATITSELKAEQTNYCPPVNTETSGEVDVYAEIVADNQASLVNYSDVAFYINSSIAASIKDNATVRSRVKNAIVAEVEARNSALANSYYGYSNTQIEAAVKVEKNAQIKFENYLSTSSDTQTSYETAWDIYFDAIVNGYSSTSISMTHHAEAREISGKAMINFNGSLDSETKFQLEKMNAYLKAKLVAEAVVKEYEKAGADETEVQEVENENNTLLVEISNSTSIEGINNAYANYNAAIRANMKTTFETMAASFTVIDSTIEATLKTTLEAAVTASANIQSLISAYAAFYASVNSTVSSELEISDANKLEAFANIYALIYMHN